ncbi:hypothetical protein LBYZC6_04440 [Lacrimispora brassicae]
MSLTIPVSELNDIKNHFPYMLFDEIEEQELKKYKNLIQDLGDCLELEKYVWRSTKE